MLITPITLAEANTMVRFLHRHHRPARGHLWSMGAWDDQRMMRAAAIVGRPVSRHLDDGATVEITRVASDGYRNACSALYAACRREARRRGYHRIITYTLETESGASLRAAGFTHTHTTKAESWHRDTRPRDDKHPTCRKHRWESA